MENILKGIMIICFIEIVIVFIHFFTNKNKFLFISLYIFIGILLLFIGYLLFSIFIN